MKEEKYLRLNIALKPPQNVANKIIELSKQLGKDYNSVFILDGKNFYPHITVYSPEYPEDNINKVLEGVGEISKKFSEVALNYKEMKAGQGFIGVSFELTPEIKKLHESVVEKFNLLRDGHIRKKYEASDYKMRMSEEKKQNIAKYGYPSSMSLYSPHLTIIRLEDEQEAERVVRDLEWNTKQFVVDTIAVYKMGENGTCIEPVKEVSLR